MSFPGEFGTKLETAGDEAWLHDLSQWINNIGPANDGMHTDVTSFFYWYVPVNALVHLHPSRHTKAAAWLTTLENPS